MHTEKAYCVIHHSINLLHTSDKKDTRMLIIFSINEIRFSTKFTSNVSSRVTEVNLEPLQNCEGGLKSAFIYYVDDYEGPR